MATERTALRRCSRCSVARPEADYLGADGEPRVTCSRCRTWRQRGGASILERAIATEPKIAAPAPAVRTYVIVSDVHVPYQDPVACSAVTDLIRDVRPHGLVIAGDFLDLYELSRYNSGSVAKMEGRRIAETFSAGNKLLDEWLEAAGPGEHHYLDGNHEGRLRDWLHTGNNSAFLDDSGTDIQRRLGLPERGVTYHRGEHAQLMLGKLIVTHGRWCNKYHAAKHLDEFRHSVLYGHTHAPQFHVAAAYNSQQIGCGIGHLADPTSPAMDYAPAPSKWCQGFALVHVRSDESFHILPILMWQRRFFYGGKSYGAA